MARKKLKRNPYLFKTEEDLNLQPETPEDIAFRQKLQSEHRRYLKSLTKEQKLFIRNKLSNPLWRLNNLYHIRDKYSKLITLKLNYAQKRVTSINHNRKIILKSRQQGISTLYVADNLDKALFQSGFSAGIQSYGLDEANKLKMRAQLMWELYDPDLLDLLNIRLISDNQKGMLFSNGSILKIGNFRGDTLQSLHISELAKIDKDRPDKSLELKTGAFQAVATNNIITIESTAEMPHGLFYDIWQKSYRKLKTNQQFTPLDFYPIFISWLEDSDCQLDLPTPIQESQEYKDYIAELQKQGYHLNLTQQQKNWLILKLDELGDDFNKEYPATPELAFKQTTEGTFFLKQYKKLLSQKRIIPEYNYFPPAPVYLAFDLGINDEMVILFLTIQNNKPILINEYHNTGEGFKHYVEVIDHLAQKYKYNIVQTFMPHDINVKELGTGLTRLEIARQLGLPKIRVLPKLTFKDSIEAARNLLDAIYIPEKNTPNTLAAIQSYRRKYNKQLGIYTDEDIHDIHSNYAAALRYMAQGLGYSKISRSNKNFSYDYRKKQIRKKHNIKQHIIDNAHHYSSSTLSSISIDI